MTHTPSEIEQGFYLYSGDDFPEYSRTLGCGCCGEPIYYTLAGYDQDGEEVTSEVVSYQPADEVTEMIDAYPAVTVVKLHTAEYGPDVIAEWRRITD